MRIVDVVLVSTAAVGPSACSSTPAPPTTPTPAEDAGGAPSSDDGGAPFGLPRLEDLPSALTSLSPGGDTTCAFGTPFSFFVQKGRVDRVLVEFSGGGACWNDATCIDSPTFLSEVPFLPPGLPLPGVYDHGDARNPFREWTHVFIPYCTGDIHWGDSTQTYGSGDTAKVVRHKGAVNVRAVLQWLFHQVKDPSKVAVAGCSAGAYASILWSPLIRDTYPNARLYHFGDSGAGITTDEFQSGGLNQWNPWGAFPAFIENPKEVPRLSDLYGIVARRYPSDRFSQLSFTEDSDQKAFFERMGGTPSEWSGRMRATLGTLATDHENFRSLIPRGEDHCVLPSARFYETDIDGRTPAEWLAEYVDDGDAVSRATP
jgi:hypothetical protein